MMMITTTRMDGGDEVELNNLLIALKSSISLELEVEHRKRIFV